MSDVSGGFHFSLICPKCDSHLHPLCIRLCLVTAVCFLAPLKKLCSRRADAHGKYAFHVVLDASIDPDCLL